MHAGPVLPQRFSFRYLHSEVKPAVDRVVVASRLFTRRTIQRRRTVVMKSEEAAEAPKQSSSAVLLLTSCHELRCQSWEPQHLSTSNWTPQMVDCFEGGP